MKTIMNNYPEFVKDTDELTVKSLYSKFTTLDTFKVTKGAIFVGLLTVRPYEVGVIVYEVTDDGHIVVLEFVYDQDWIAWDYYRDTVAKYENEKENFFDEVEKFKKATTSVEFSATFENSTRKCSVFVTVENENYILTVFESSYCTTLEKTVVTGTEEKISKHYAKIAKMFPVF